MKALKYLLDTSTCSFALKRQRGVAEKLMAVSASDVAVSAITLAEAWTGAAKSARPDVTRRAWDAFFKPVKVLPFDAAAAGAYAATRALLERQGRMIGGNDCLIAATALVHRLVVVTADLDEFARVPGLAVEDWSTRD